MSCRIAMDLICYENFRLMDNGQHKHNVGEMCQMGVWGRRRVRAELLAILIEGKVRLCLDYFPRYIMQDLELELGIRLTYIQSWRVREFVRMMVLGRPEDHYKLLSWMCAAIVRANPKSAAFCEIEECHFQRMFVAYAANINGFKLGCHMMLFVDRCHLSGLYKETMLVITLVTPFPFPRLVICNVLQAPHQQVNMLISLTIIQLLTRCIMVNSLRSVAYLL